MIYTKKKGRGRVSCHGHTHRRVGSLIFLCIVWHGEEDTVFRFGSVWLIYSKAFWRSNGRDGEREAAGLTAHVVEHTGGLGGH